MLFRMRCILILLIVCVSLSAQDSAAEIRALLEGQSAAWNRGDIEDFMDGYLRSSDLHFLGEQGLTSGWHATLQRYQSTYPDTATMGKLRFELRELTQRTDDVYTVVGRYFLERQTLEALNGYFLLVVLRTADGWKIAADSTH